jgi:hypothetical protein
VPASVPGYRAENLTARVTMRPGDTRDVTGQLDGEQHRSIGRMNFRRVKKRSGHGRENLWKGVLYRGEDVPHNIKIHRSVTG